MIVQKNSIKQEDTMAVIKTVELEIEYARMIYKMDEYMKEKESLQKKIKEYQQDLAVCNNQMNKLSADIMATTLKLAKTRGRA
jgi:predicted  nucleic acid-binding Zn-ribbon protein